MIFLLIFLALIEAAACCRKSAKKQIAPKRPKGSFGAIMFFVILQNNYSKKQELASRKKIFFKIYSATALSSAILTITSTAFCILSTGTYSYFPWKLCPPAKIFGQGKPINDSLEPSVPPRIGLISGLIPMSFIACSANFTMCITGSTFSRML